MSGQTSVKTEKITLHNGELLTYVSSASVEQELKQAVNESPVSRALMSDSDLLPQVYEGLILAFNSLYNQMFSLFKVFFG